MSLLMDALRKAEEAKRAAAQSEAPSPQETALASMELSPSSDSGLALEPLEAPAQNAPAAPAARDEAHEEAQRKAIQNAFAAKAHSKSPNDQIFLVALIGVACLGFISLGAYVWWQMQPRGNLTPPQAPPSLAKAPQALPAAPTPMPLPRAEAPANRAERSPAFATNLPTPADEKSFGRLPNAAAVPEPPSSPIRITQSRQRVSPLLEQGYAALQQGNLVQAQQAYDKMLAADPKNLDALYGLAAIAVQRQQLALAEEYYLRIIEANPRDAVAQAGLAGLTAQPGSNAESRLKALIAEQPDVPQLQFALGNVYAQSQRWRDAQQAYFLAYKNDSDNPDNAFNLAVSLDQLHQEKLAAQYYGEALRLAANRPAAFSREQAQARLRDLQGQAR
jgi:tetratricopeptide (TPR) repeat protein